VTAKRSILLWIARYRRIRNSRHRSAWDLSNTDTLEIILQENRRSHSYERSV